MNELMRHNVAWPPVPIKLPSDIPKFKGKVGEDPSAHINTFHLSFSSNSLNDDSVRLRIFQRMLTHVAAKWYIELPSVAYDSFLDLPIMFLNHFHLHVRYDAGTLFVSFSIEQCHTHT